MKKCKDCFIEKFPKDFYGIQNECKECTKKRVQKREENLRKDPLFVEKEKSRGREKYRRLYAGKPVLKDSIDRINRYESKFPEKYMAKCKCRSLKKPFQNAERHHWSYNKEHYKDVIWLEKVPHMKCHRFLVYDQERMMYRRFDTNELLDSKLSHTEFIDWCIKNKED